MKLFNKIYKLFALFALFLFISCPGSTGPNSGDSNNENQNPEEKAVLVDINISSLPSTVSYDVTKNEKFSVTGLKVNLIYDDGTQEECTDYKLSLEDGTTVQDGFEFLEKHVGQLTINVTYIKDDKTYKSKFNITIIKTEKAPEIKKLYVNTFPKSVYKKGETLDLTDLTVCYEDTIGQSHPVDEKDYFVELLKFDESGEKSESLDLETKLEEGSYTVSIKFNDGSKDWYATFNISVELSPEQIFNGLIIDVEKLKTEYRYGDSFDKSTISLEYYDGLYVKHPYTGEYWLEYYSADEEKYVPLPEILPPNWYLIYIVCEQNGKEFRAEFSVNVKVPQIINFYVFTSPKQSYTAGETLDLSEMQVCIENDFDEKTILKSGEFELELFKKDVSGEESAEPVAVKLDSVLEGGIYELVLKYKDGELVWKDYVMISVGIAAEQVFNGLSIDESTLKTEYVYGEAFDKDSVKVQYIDGNGEIKPYTGEYWFEYYDYDKEDYLPLPEKLSPGKYFVDVACKENGTIFRAQFWINVAKPDVSPEDDVTKIQIWTQPKTLYSQGEKLDLSKLELRYYDGNNESHKFTKEYTIKLYNKDTEKYEDSEDSINNLQTGRYTVEIGYNNGYQDLKATFDITVVKAKNIEEFKYSTEDGSATIGGFKGTEDFDPDKDYNHDYDAPYETVYSKPSDFKYEFIEGSTTDIRITRLKPGTPNNITDLTIPAKIDGYNVRQVGFDTFYYMEGKSDTPNNWESSIRNILIEEGVQGFCDGELRKNTSFYNEYTNFIHKSCPYLKKLILPKGFSLDSGFEYPFDISGVALEELQLPDDLEKIDFEINAGRLKKLVIPASVKAVDYGNSSTHKGWSLPECEEIEFKGKTDFSGVLSIPKVKELTINGLYFIKFLFKEDCPKKINFTDNACGSLVGAERLEEVVIDQTKNEEDVVFIGGHFEGTYDITYHSGLTDAGFKDYKNLKKITLLAKENSKILIMKEAFKNCTSLEEFIIPNGMAQVHVAEAAFGNCTSLKKVEFADCPTIIEKDAFYGCKSLSSIRFPQKIENPILEQESYSGRTFSLHYCSGIRSYTSSTEYIFEDDVDVYIDSNAFYGTLLNEFAFKENVMYFLQENAFHGCNIDSLSFEEGCYVNRNRCGLSFEKNVSQFDPNKKIKEIDISKAAYVDLSFNDFTALETLKVGNSMYLQGGLDNCRKLKNVIVGENGYFAPRSMRNCELLEEINIKGKGLLPSYLTEEIVKQIWAERGIVAANDDRYEIGAQHIDDEAFKGCLSLKKLSLECVSVGSYVFGKDNSTLGPELIFENLFNISDYAFSGWQGETLSLNIQKRCAYPDGSYTTPKDGKCIFSNCPNLEEVTITDFCSSIPNECFYNCTNLESVVIKGMVGMDFCDSCFYNCTNLKSVVIEQLEGKKMNFYPYCFYNCNKLEQLDFISKITYFGLSENCFYKNENILQIFRDKNISMDGMIWLLAFQDTSLLYDNLEIDYEYKNISSFSVKNLTIPRSIYTFVPTGFAENNKWIQSVTLDCDIGSRAFKGCSSLTTVTLGATTVHSVRADSFADCPKLTKIIVPEKYLEQYKKSSKWKPYKDLLCTE